METVKCEHCGTELVAGADTVIGMQYLEVGTRESHEGDRCRDVLRVQRDDAERATVAAIVTRLREVDGPGTMAWCRTAARWIESGAWRKDPR